MDEIVNRVQSSGLISIDLASFKPTIEVLDIDMVDLLWERTVLKEKEFRTWIKDHNWKKYSGKAVYVHCSENAWYVRASFYYYTAVFVAGLYHWNQI